MASGVTGHRAPDDDMKFSHSRSPPHPSFLGSLLRLQLQRAFFTGVTMALTGLVPAREPRRRRRHPPNTWTSVPREDANPT